ncbi:MAG: type II/IV secretion system protein [Xanthomonadales bacterium]|nr:type II/IV secretion system protein [Xanthomonadales bacterium]MBK7146444.1 type II/IV secretion system protein [Xanthomonadales bacterium]MCC6562437.1 type II/IV secretion system protein [Xanthomonadales bacterium]
MSKHDTHKVVPLEGRAAFTTSKFSEGKRVELDEVLAAMIVEKLVTAEAAKSIRTGKSLGRGEVHPLVLIANAKLPDPREPSRHLTLETLTQWLAHKAGLAYLRIDPTKIDIARVGEVVAPSYATRYRILPVSVSADALTIATSEPFDTRWLPDLERLLRRKVTRVVANPLDVNRFLMEFAGISRNVRKAKDGNDAGDQRGVPNFEMLVELGKSGDLGAEDSHVVKIVDWLLQYAYEQRASDIHLEPRREMSPARFRVDGVLHKVYELPTPVMAAVVSRIKILGRMDIAERRRPQDGRIKTRSPGGREVEMRISTMPTAFGEKVVMRIFDPDVVLKNFSELGFNARDEAQWREMIERPHGIVLVTGPTGSGKTTTLYSTLKHLATPELNVCTIEDPIEMIAPAFNQMQVQPSIDLTFAAGVRTLLRQDPDIIMVGEIRDLETAEMAVQAALTGHLVLSTLHTNDAPSAVTRLLDLGVPHYLIQSSVNGIVAQRLARTLCPRCKQPVAVDPGAWQALTRGFELALPEHARAAKGCDDCRHTGYYGRTAVYEMLTLSPKLRREIRADLDLPAFGETCLHEGMRPLRLAGAELIGRGLTTVKEVVSVLPTID